MGSLPLFRPFGINVRVDASWFFIAALVTWSLASGLFPARVPGLEPAWYWAMGFAGAMGLFFSIVFHELCHALAGRRFGVELRGIRLFIFGGVAEMTHESPSPRAEFVIAAVGPLSSFVLGGAAFALARGTEGLLPVWTEAILLYLAGLNVVLAIFNLVPAFPLDGGRLLRAILWHRQKSIARATRVTSTLGRYFGLLLVALGVISVVRGDWTSGLWWVLIGLFLRGAADQAYRQVIAQHAVMGHPVREVMTAEPLSVHPDSTIRDLIEGASSRTPATVFLVVKDGTLLGTFPRDRADLVPREKWDSIRVKDVILPLAESNTISPEADVVTALRQMQAHRTTHLLVVEEGRVAGLVTRQDVLGFISSRVEGTSGGS